MTNVFFWTCFGFFLLNLCEPYLLQLESYFMIFSLALLWPFSVTLSEIVIYFL